MEEERATNLHSGFYTLHGGREGSAGSLDRREVNRSRRRSGTWARPERSTEEVASVLRERKEERRSGRGAGWSRRVVRRESWAVASRRAGEERLVAARARREVRRERREAHWREMQGNQADICRNKVVREAEVRPSLE